MLGDDSTRGIIGIAKVDDIDMSSSLGYLRHESIFRHTRHIDDVGPTSLLKYSASANHHVRVDIDGIDGVGDTDEIVPMKYLLEIARVGFCSIIDEYLVNVEVYATWQEVVFQYRLSQEVVALFWSVSVKALDSGHLVGGTMHRLDDGRTEGLCHVANAE